MKKPKDDIPVGLLREFLDYDPKTGVLTWKPRVRRHFKTERSWRAWNARFSGTEAGGGINGRGYRYIRILVHRYQAHRVAWALFHGKWPFDGLDHENHARGDNRIKNLHVASQRENLKNQSLRSNNTSGVMGVCWHKITSKWCAQITVDGKNIHLGLFTSKASAIAARKAADNEYGYHPNHGEELQYDHTDQA